MTITDLNRKFSDRSIVHVNAGSNSDFLVMAIPVSKAEIAVINEGFGAKKAWKSIKTKEMIAIGDVFKPTPSLLKHLYSEPRVDVNTGMGIESYYYPPLGKCPDRTDHCIPFESTYIAWSYYAKILSNHATHRDVLIAKLKK